MTTKLFIAVLLYSIAIALADSAKTFFDIDSLQEVKIRSVAESSSSAKYMAQSVLENVKGDVYERIPEEIEEARMMNPNHDETKPQQDNSDIEWLNVKPNPFSNQAIINYKIQTKTTKGLLVVYDAFGKLVKQVKLPDSEEGIITLDLKQFSEGVYFCHLIVDGKIVYSKKLFLIK